MHARTHTQFHFTLSVSSLHTTLLCWWIHNYLVETLVKIKFKDIYVFHWLAFSVHSKTLNILLVYWSFNFKRTVLQFPSLGITTTDSLPLIYFYVLHWSTWVILWNCSFTEQAHSKLEKFLKDSLIEYIVVLGIENFTGKDLGYNTDWKLFAPLLLYNCILFLDITSARHTYKNSKNGLINGDEILALDSLHQLHQKYDSVLIRVYHISNIINHYYMLYNRKLLLTNISNQGLQLLVKA